MPAKATAPLARSALSVATEDLVLFFVRNIEEYAPETLIDPEQTLCSIRFARERLASEGTELPNIELKDVLDALNKAVARKWLLVSCRGDKRRLISLCVWAEQAEEHLGKELLRSLRKIGGLIHTAYVHHLCSMAQMEAYRLKVRDAATPLIGVEILDPRDLGTPNFAS